jgi:hypothetical protein
MAAAFGRSGGGYGEGSPRPDLSADRTIFRIAGDFSCRSGQSLQKLLVYSIESPVAENDDDISGLRK